MAKGYAGRIGNGGSQVVKAPNQVKRGRDTGKVIRGGDLRDGRNKDRSDKDK